MKFSKGGIPDFIVSKCPPPNYEDEQRIDRESVEVKTPPKVEIITGPELKKLFGLLNNGKGRKY